MNKILIVEDDKSLLKALMDSFNKAGYDVEKAEDGKIAIETVDTFEPELILLDILMPNLNGIEFIKMLYGDMKKTDIPVIMLTNLQPDQDIMNKLEIYPPVFYLIKADNSIKEIIEKVEEVLQKGVEPIAETPE